MKQSFLLVLMLLFATFYLFAQMPTISQVKIDTFVDIPPNPIDGKSYVRCVIPAEYKTCVNCEPDTIKWAKVYTISQLPPKYDTIRTKVELYPKQEYYTLKMDKADNLKQIVLKDTIITAPIYQIIKQKIVYSPSQSLWILERKDANSLAANPADCIALRRVLTNERAAEVKIYSLQQAAQKITYQNGKEYIENLPWDSPYLVRNEVPAIEKYKIEYKEIAPPRTCIKDSTFEMIDKRPQPKNGYITRTHLVRRGSVREWTEYIICERNTLYPKIALIIKRLYQLGYYKGRLDIEELTPEVRVALIQFQKDHDLQIGRLDSETLQLLGFDWK